jgi:hypothetical protein
MGLNNWVLVSRKVRERRNSRPGTNATANNGFLLPCQLVFDPGAAARPIGDAAETSIVASSVGLASAL